MIGYPVPKKDFCAKERCQEDPPATVWVAGFFVLVLFHLFAAPVHAARCSATEGAGPEMVVLPVGTFIMGSPDDELGRDDGEGPQHEVTVASFALAVCEVTVGEFSRFVEDSNYQTEAEAKEAGCWHNSAPGLVDWEVRPEFTWRNASHGDQEDDHPVVCVTWNDAVAYAEWFSELTGEPYRLPTEAEWEYAARASSVEPRYFAERSPCAYANGADSAFNTVYTDFTVADCDDSVVHTAPVSGFAPNDWGLHDMLGNVWEWMQDCWHDRYTNAPDDGSAWLESDGGDCDRRVLRGGGWDILPEDLRSAGRSWDFRVNAGLSVGFRLARTVSPSAL